MEMRSGTVSLEQYRRGDEWRGEWNKHIRDGIRSTGHMVVSRMIKKWGGSKGKSNHAMGSTSAWHALDGMVSRIGSSLERRI